MSTVFSSPPTSFAAANEAPTGATGRGLISFLNDFFFRKEVPYGLAIVRILMPIAVLWGVVERWPWLRELYTLDGAPAPLFDNYGYPGYLPILPVSIAVPIYTVMMLAMFCGIVGWRSRLSFAICTPLYMYFQMLDSNSTATKYTVIATHMMMLLAFSDCGAVWSVDSWLKRRKLGSFTADELDSMRSPIWIARLFQLLLGIIYFGAALTKMHTPTFFSGDQLMYWMMTYINNSHTLGDWLTQYPVLLVVFAYVTIVWEVVFLFTVWRNWSRLPALLIGMLFHIMTIFTLGLYLFPAIMCASYLCFLTEEDMEWFCKKVGYRLRAAAPNEPSFAAVSSFATGAAIDRPAGAVAEIPAGWFSGRQSLAAYGIGFLAMTVLLTEVEYRLDHYRERTADGGLALRLLSESTELDPAKTAAAMRGVTMPLREKDKFLSFDLGTIIAGEHLIDHRKEFTVGEALIAQAHLNPPHEDVFVECTLYRVKKRRVENNADDENGDNGLAGPMLQQDELESAGLATFGQVVPRESLRSFFRFILKDPVLPGEYAVVMKSAGQEVARRRFTLKPDGNVPKDLRPEATTAN